MATKGNGVDVTGTGIEQDKWTKGLNNIMCHFCVCRVWQVKSPVAPKPPCTRVVVPETETIRDSEFELGCNVLQGRGPTAIPETPHSDSNCARDDSKDHCKETQKCGHTVRGQDRHSCYTVRGQERKCGHSDHPHTTWNRHKYIY